MMLAKEGAGTSETGVVVAIQLGTALFGIASHCSELMYVERLAFIAYALLTEQGGTSVIEFDGKVAYKE